MQLNVETLVSHTLFVRLYQIAAVGLSLFQNAEITNEIRKSLTVTEADSLPLITRFFGFRAGAAGFAFRLFRRSRCRRCNLWLLSRCVTHSEDEIWSNQIRLDLENDIFSRTVQWNRFINVTSKRIYAYLVKYWWRVGCYSFKSKVRMTRFYIKYDRWRPCSAIY